MQDIEHWEDELTKEKELVVDRRKATRYLNQCCIYGLYIERMLCGRTGETFVCVCVSLWLFSGSLVFSVVAATTNIVVISSNTTTFKPHVPCLSLSLPPSLPLSLVDSCRRMLNQNNKRTNWFFLILFLFFSLFTRGFFCILFFYSIYSSSIRVEW